MFNSEVFDYVRTRETILFQMATFSPHNSVLGFPIFVRDERGDRRIDGKSYRKIDFRKDPLPTLTDMVRRTDLSRDFYQVDHSAIETVYRHRKLKLDEKREKVVTAISDIIGYDVSMIGSSLLGCDLKSSDMDILVYGSSAPPIVRQRWPDILKLIGANDISNEDVRRKVDEYLVRFNFDEEVIRRLLHRRNFKFYVDGIEGSIMFTYDQQEDIPKHPSKIIVAPIEVTLQDEVVEDTHSLMMPRMYQCKNWRVWSFRWLDRGLVVASEKVKIHGHQISDHDIILSKDTHYILPYIK
ncbi:MAG: hypothetical protein ABIH82_04850 [Candidatus Woesearchaeota archaeon]